MKYLVLPLTAYASWKASRDEACAEAKLNATRYEEDFVVLDVTFVGMYERVAPIYTNEDPTDTTPVPQVALPDAPWPVRA